LAEQAIAKNRELRHMGQLRGTVISVTPLQQNCTLLWDDASMCAVVVDPGGDVDRILGAIEQAGVSVGRIWLTHGHLDHAGGADELREKLNGVPIEGPDQRDEFLLQTLEEQARNYGLSVRNVAPNRWLREGDAVALGVHRFETLHCPGHTPGHLVFVNHAAHFALVGDVLFQGSIGRTDFPYGDHHALIRAITEKLLPLGDDYSFLCGHGPGSTIGAERRSNPFLRAD
jgi:glyoxylase-like metal-dependent hydrolase (beta-lactamase superfamily II)